MGINVNTTCSECYHQEEMDLEQRQDEIRCSQCGHSVPMLDEDDYDEIERDQKKRETLGYAAIGLFVLAIVCFYFLYSGMEPAAKMPEHLQSGDDPGGLVPGFIMALSALGALVLGVMASAKKVICEY